MLNDWLADVGGQIAAGVIVAILVSITAAFTPWGKRLGGVVGARIARGWRAILSVRVTTRTRIDSEIADAVQRATAELTEEDELDDEPRPLRPDEHEGWVLGPASQPRHWELRNQTRETVTVEGIYPAGNSWPFEWEDPELPVRLAPGQSISIRARRLRSDNFFMPWDNSAMANVVYEDEHGDERAAAIWVLD